MPFFNQDKSENSNYSSYSSTSNQWNSDKLDFKDIDDKDETDDVEGYDFGIKFIKELSNGSLVFLIVDNDYDHAGGYVIVSSSGIPTVIKDDFYEIADRDCEYIASLAKNFFEATKK